MDLRQAQDLLAKPPRTLAEVPQLRSGPYVGLQCEYRLSARQDDFQRSGAQTLIAQLQADRELEGATQRPIIYLCHSLGGIIVKRIESNLLNALEEESETLQNITDQFAPLIPNFRIFFFWEQEKTDLHYTKEYIVNETSAAPILDSTERSGIAADHRTMCRFEANSSQGFRTVMAALQRYSREAPDVIKARTIRAAAIQTSQRWYEATELVKEYQGVFSANGRTESLGPVQNAPSSGPGFA
ncbi:hypothetical protein MMC30_001270 [Trapelia coarctata]|nr:hypothetical protein [Trapelia coarctata]